MYFFFSVVFLNLVALSFAKYALPLHTSSRFILDARNHRVKLRCINWAGHLELLVPEGLQHRSIASIASWISEAGFNCVRLTYSIDMALSPDLSLAAAFAQDLPGIKPSALAELHQRVLLCNPTFNDETTVQTVFAAVVLALEKHDLLVILDNHVSRASWCCNLTDGNGWWHSEADPLDDPNTRFFDPEAWLAGLSAMASFAKAHSNIVGMSLRNEPRFPPSPSFGFDLDGGLDLDFHLDRDLDLDLEPTSPHDPLLLVLEADARTADWRNRMTAGAEAVHNVHPALLILISGTSYATNLRHLLDDDDEDQTDRSNNAMLPFTTIWPGRIVWELHAYAWTPAFRSSSSSSSSSSNCAAVAAHMDERAGFVLEPAHTYTAPLILSEFGVAMSPHRRAHETDYLACLVRWMEERDAEWALWALQGSYYVREGAVNVDETYGALDARWTAWREEGFAGRLGKMWDVREGVEVESRGEL